MGYWFGRKSIVITMGVMLPRASGTNRIDLMSPHSLRITGVMLHESHN
jgi:hypothetical protein